MLLVVGGYYLDFTAGGLVANRGLLVRDGRIAAMDLEAAEHPAAQRLELSAEHCILPGFIDLHAHYNVRLFRRRREEFEVLPATYLANGATTTFTAGEYLPEEMDQLRRDLDRGLQAGPRLWTSGPYFGTARRGWGRGEVDAAAIRREVDYWADRGVAGFKAKQIRSGELRVLIEQAHRHGRTVTGHLGSGHRNSVNPREAIEMGIDRVEHFLGGALLAEDRPAYDSLEQARADTPQAAEIIETYVHRKVWYDPTVTAFGYFGERGRYFEQWADERRFFTDYVRDRLAAREHRPLEQFERIFWAKQPIVRAYWEAGGRLTLGTDHFSSGDYLPGFGVHRELEVLAACGIPPLEVLRIATLRGAEAMHREREVGSLEEGKWADLYIVRGDPLRDIRATRSGDYVVRQGVVHRPQELLASVEGRLGPRDEREERQW